jgi:hypothetical protein
MYQKTTKKTKLNLQQATHMVILQQSILLSDVGCKRTSFPTYWMKIEPWLGRWAKYCKTEREFNHWTRGNCQAKKGCHNKPQHLPKGNVSM